MKENDDVFNGYLAEVIANASAVAVAEFRKSEPKTDWGANIKKGVGELSNLPLL